MRLFMDVHHTLPEGATAKDVADAHMADLRVQEKYGQLCQLLGGGGPGQGEAHGLTADEIHEVVQGSEAAPAGAVRP